MRDKHLRGLIGMIICLITGIIGYFSFYGYDTNYHYGYNYPFLIIFSVFGIIVYSCSFIEEEKNENIRNN